MPYSLLVKGTHDDVIQKCLEYDLIRVGRSKITSCGEQVQIVLDEGNTLFKLQTWFAEDLSREAPYPAGSLLHFTEVRNLALAE